MNFRRTHDRLLSFAVSAMLTSAVLATAPDAFVAAASGPQPAAVMSALDGLRAAGWSAMRDVALPAPAAAPQSASPAPAAATSAALTAAQLQRIAQLTVEHGVTIALDKAVTDALGLTTGAATITGRQLSVDSRVNGLHHAFQPLDGGGYVLILVSADNTSAHSFRTDAGQQLVAAVASTAASPALVALPVPQAQQELKDELSFWASFADTH